MTSVNKIKELAEAKEYSLAVEILDSQDLEKSLNPQFLRVCGEVYENVGRITDARNMYVKAHSMGPESNRILFSIITFYLKQGYFELAEQYVKQYRDNARGAAQELKNIDYVVRKAEGADLKELESYLEPYYSHNMDEEWSLELFLLHRMQNKDTEILAADYMATFRRSASKDVLQDVLDGRISPEELFYVYAKHAVADDDPQQEEIRDFEREQLKKDYLRMHPGGASDPDSVEDSGISDEEAAEILENQDTEQKFKSFLKRKFRKKPKDDEDAEGEASEQETGETEEDSEEKPEQEEAKTEPEGTDVPAEPAEETAETAAATEETEQKQDETASAAPAVETEAPKEDRLKRFVSQFSDRGKNREEMQELEADPMEDVFSVDFDDGFAAESDTISDLAETEKEAYQNPFDLINAYKIDQKEKEEIRETYGNIPKDLKDTFEAAKEYVPAPEPVEEPEPEPIGEPEIEEPIVEPEEEPIPWEEPAAEAEPEPIEEPEIEEPEEEPEIEEPEEEPIPWEEPAAEAEPEPIEEPEIVEPEEEPEIEEPEEEPEPIEEPEIEESEEEPIPWEEPAAEAEPEPIEEPEIEEPEDEPEPIEEPEVEEPEEEAEPKKSAFDVLVEKESEKLDEGLLEEERLQREAEALLASLGIKL